MPNGQLATYQNRLRDKIKTGKIVKKLQAHVLENEELSQTQLTAARMLLNRTLPELKVETVTGDGQAVDVKTIRTEDLINIIEAKAVRVDIEER